MWKENINYYKSMNGRLAKHLVLSCCIVWEWCDFSKNFNDECFNRLIVNLRSPTCITGVLVVVCCLVKTVDVQCAQRKWKLKMSLNFRTSLIFCVHSKMPSSDHSCFLTGRVSGDEQICFLIGGNLGDGQICLLIGRVSGDEHSCFLIGRNLGIDGYMLTL